VVESGAVRGVALGASVAFFGIPYALPPVGELRFRPPALPGCFEGVFDASAYGPACPQLDNKKKLVGEEDCLSLNVWTPEVSPSSRPVLVFIHGGGNVEGSSRDLLGGKNPVYDGRRLAEEQGAVVVTLNYRLGSLGFLALPELAKESPEGSTGNYGSLDQIAALAWVKRNIQAFGGDPSRVMVFGESAGARDTCALLASPLAAGLFQAALLQSPGEACRQPTLAAVAPGMGKLVAGSDCGETPDVVACLRALPVEKLIPQLSVGLALGIPAQPQLEYGPILDGHFLLQEPIAAFAEGKHNKVALVVGSNAEEFAALLGPTPVPTQEELTKAIGSLFAGLGAAAVATIVATYPASSYDSPRDALVAVLSDQRFVCPARAVARAVRKGQQEPVFRYSFRRRTKTPNGEVPAQHGIELPFVFGTLSDIPGFTPTGEDLALSQSMMASWVRLAATKDLGSGEPAWPLYDTALDTHLVLDVPISSGTLLREAECDVWDALQPGP
jgi:para-nitrobenzyl esterase